jgi:hypothetical protein
VFRDVEFELLLKLKSVQTFFFSNLPLTSPKQTTYNTQGKIKSQLNTDRFWKHLFIDPIIDSFGVWAKDVDHAFAVRRLAPDGHHQVRVRLEIRWKTNLTNLYWKQKKKKELKNFKIEKELIIVPKLKRKYLKNQQTIYRKRLF